MSSKKVKLTSAVKVEDGGSGGKMLSMKKAKLSSDVKVEGEFKDKRTFEKKGRATPTVGGEVGSGSGVKGKEVIIIEDDVYTCDASDAIRDYFGITRNEQCKRIVEVWPEHEFILDQTRVDKVYAATVVTKLLLGHSNFKLSCDRRGDMFVCCENDADAKMLDFQKAPCFGTVMNFSVIPNIYDDLLDITKPNEATYKLIARDLKE